MTAPEPVAIPLLEVLDLVVEFPSDVGTVRAVDGVTFSVAAGETVGLVGESGSGKSVTALSLMRMLSPGARILSGSIRFQGRNVSAMSEVELRRLRGCEFSLVSQDPMTSLNPVLTVRRQVEEVISAHARLGRKEVRRRAEEALRLVGIDLTRIDDYPHRFSGGMRQRVTIAIAVANHPKLIIADEPTTALDVTIQAQILELLRELNKDLGAALILITHDLGVVAEVCDRVLVMYAGQLLEEAPVEALFRQPCHPYTAGLLQSMPHLKSDRNQRLVAIEGRHPDSWQRPTGCLFHPRCSLVLEPRCLDIRPTMMEVAPHHSSACWLVQSQGVSAVDGQARITEAVPAHRAPERNVLDTPLLEIRQLTKHFPVAKRLPWGPTQVVHAVDRVDLAVSRGGTLGLVGESGCGKSTLARVVLGIHAATSGSIIYDQQDITEVSPGERRALRRRMQMIFQDPYASLDPRVTVGGIVGEPLDIHGLAKGSHRAERVAELFELVGLSPQLRTRYPHELSGGQRQRIGIARALGVEPELIVCDEPLSSLDVSIQAQIVNLLQDLRGRVGLTYLLVAHDLAVVHHMSDTIAVMYLGRIVEVGDSDAVCARPLHPYTASLLSSSPQPGNRRTIPVLTGDLPSPITPPSGCRFRSRCPIGPLHNRARTICLEVEPELTEYRPGRFAACHFAGETEIDSAPHEKAGSLANAE